jgi:alkylated DNA repair dioxygenase AlkB
VENRLLDLPPVLPAGFLYTRDLISPGEEQDLAERLSRLALKPFEFHGYLGNRKVASFGWRYDYSRQTLGPADPAPDFLLALRERVAAFSRRDAKTFQQILVTEYAPGAGIGWHRDKPQFEDVVGVSFLAPCVFRLRRKVGDRWRRASLRLDPRSAYLMTGASRSDWEHSIPPVDALRYSVTFRTFRPK